MRPHTTEEREDALTRFENATELPMLLLAVAFVPVIGLPWLFDLSDGWETALDGVSWAIWGTFAAELAIRTYLAPRRLPYLVHNWLDVLIVALPFLRPLRIVRSARAFRLLRLARVAAPAARAVSTSRRILTKHGLHYLLATALVLVAVAAGLATLLERNAAGSTIDSYTGGLWWALATVTTVGYGDVTPVTAEGRGVGVFLMLIGIAVFGAITANIAAFFVEESAEASAGAAAGDEVELRDLLNRIDARLARAEGATGEPSEPRP